MKKAITCIALMVLLLTCLCVIPQQANAATEGGYTYSVSDGEATITGYTGPGGDTTIPDTLGGYPVTAIGEAAFYNCDSLTSVTIPGSVQTIGDYAFNGCTSLTAVTIPDSVQTIGGAAFSECTSLTSVTIGNSVQTIDVYAFSDCASLTTVTIPDSVQTIGKYAFRGCTSLTGIWVAESNPNYSSDDRGVLYNKNKTQLLQAPGAISGSYTVPDSVQTISKWAFDECTSLTGIWAAEGNPNYSSDDRGVLFNKDKTQLILAPGGISGSYTVPDGVQTIDEYAFCGCYSLISVTIPDSVQTIGNYAFEDCTSLTSVTIGNGVQTIGSWAFAHCASLTTVTIPDSVQTIGNYAFEDCTSLTSVTIGNSVKTIGNGAFEDCASLTAVTIGNSVQTIGSAAFYGCGSLTTVTIPDGVQTIGQYAFYNCTSLTSVTIPDSVQTIGSSAFEDCASLTTVYYGGTEAQWNQIDIDSYNEELTNATIHYSHVHDYTTVPPVTVAATCAQEGYIEYTCVHGETYREVLPKIPHNYTERTSVVAPTCTEAGYTNAICGVCGHEGQTDHVPALGHDAVVIPAVAPTCTATGLTEGFCCSRCQIILTEQEEVPALGHSFTDGVCTVCGVPDAIPGDLDGVEGVGEDDAIYLLQFILMPDLFQVTQAVDFDGNGSVDEDDAVYLLQHILMPDLFPLQ